MWWLNYLLQFNFWRRFLVETWHWSGFECHSLPQLLDLSLLVFLPQNQKKINEKKVITWQWELKPHGT